VLAPSRACFSICACFAAAPQAWPRIFTARPWSSLMLWAKLSGIWHHSLLVSTHLISPLPFDTRAPKSVQARFGSICFFPLVAAVIRSPIDLR
jgi:hypothetical protein